MEMLGKSGEAIACAATPCNSDCALQEQAYALCMGAGAQKLRRPSATIRAFADLESGMYYLEVQLEKIADEVITRTDAIYSSEESALRCADILVGRLGAMFDIDLVR